eukprot:1505014-Heterocapsa_arctica.AAC.1
MPLSVALEALGLPCLVHVQAIQCLAQHQFVCLGSQAVVEWKRRRQCWLSGQLAGYLAAWLPGCLAGWLPGW